MSAWVYVLESVSGRFYYGSTTDLARRLQQHQQGHTPTTRSGGPWRLRGSHPIDSLPEARAQERVFKRWKNPARVLAWLDRPCRQT